MADEIKIYTDSGLVIYALIRQASNMFIWDVGDAAFELQGVWSDTRLDECDLPLSEGDEILMTLPTPLGGLIASGRVVRTQRKNGTHLFSIGVQLRQLMPEEQDQILQFMESIKS